MRLFALLALMAGAAQAQTACREDGDQVVCTKAGFKTLTDLTIQYKGEAEKCDLRLTAAQARVAALEAALGAAVAAPPVQPTPPPKPVLKPALAVLAGVLGSAAITTAVVADIDPVNRAGLGLTGLCSLSAAFIIIAVP